MINVCPSGCVCHAVRAPGSNVTVAAAPRLESLESNNGSILTDPVNQSPGPLTEGFEPTLVICIQFLISLHEKIRRSGVRISLLILPANYHLMQSGSLTFPFYG